MSDVKNYLESQVKERLKRAEIFEKQVHEDRVQAINLQKAIQKYKSENVGESYEQMKENLVKSQELHYYSTLIEMQLKQELAIVKEFCTAAEILKVELNLTEEESQVIENIKGIENNFFVTDTKGKIVVQNEDNQKLLEQGLNQMLSSKERLQEIYDMIPVN